MRRILVVLFLAVIITPLVLNLAGVDGADPTAENREMAAFPVPPHDWPSAREYPAGLTLWFGDHFGLRARLVRWSAATRLLVLGVSPSPSVLKGRDGWLYYAEDGGLDDYTREALLNPEEVAAWHDATLRAHDWLRAKGIAYVFTIAPDKPVIYPEFIPATVKPMQTASRTDQVFAALTGTGIAVVDPRTALLEAKTLERVYGKTDTHWNERGAFVAYQEIVDVVRRQRPDVPPAWSRDDFSAEEADVEGRDLAGMMGLTHVLRETDLRLVPRRPRSARVVDPPGAALSAELGRLVTEIPGSPLPRAVIFRDSFSSALVPFLSEHFSRAVYVWQNDFDADLVREERPDIVIQEIVGRHLYGFVPSPELVPPPQSSSPSISSSAMSTTALWMSRRNHSRNVLMSRVSGH